MAVECITLVMQNYGTNVVNVAQGFSLANGVIPSEM